MNKLYHYIHCPFCIRVRLSLGFLKINYESKVLPYNDEVTPVKLTGVKMLPIFESENKTIQNESLDIIKTLDRENLIYKSITPEQIRNLTMILDNIGSEIHSLCMPYWIWTPEFDDDSRAYFQKKKEVKRGPFKNIIQDKEKYLKSLHEKLLKIENELSQFYQGDTFSILDIMLASHLWGMYIFPEFQFSEKIHNYLQRVKKLCNFDYHEDYWK